MAYILLSFGCLGEYPDIYPERLGSVLCEEKMTPLVWLRNNSYFVAATLSLLISVIVLSVLASRSTPLPGDRRVIDLVQSIDLPGFGILMELVTYLGFIVPVLIVLALVAGTFWRFGYRLESFFVILSFSDEVIGTIVKAIVQRPRPTVDVGDGWLVPATSSFPSGHAVHFTVFFGLLMFLTHTVIERGWLRVAIYITATSLIILVGFSRIYLEAHWPSDVLGGYLIGSLWLLILIRAYQAVRGHRTIRRRGR